MILLLILILSIFIIQAAPTQNRAAEFHNTKFIGDLHCLLANNFSKDNNLNPTPKPPIPKPPTPKPSINFPPSNDSDGDGLADNLELAFGTDPNKKDSFGNGIDDYTRIVILHAIPAHTNYSSNSSNNVSYDSDHDGLSNLIETSEFLGHKTDPNKADTDDDGLNDLEEYWWKCDPQNPDTNNDGIRDGASVDYSNPLRTYPYNDTLNNAQDLDGDGLPTAAELNDARLGTNFKEYSTDGDPYGDGQEYFAVGMPKISPGDHPLVAACPNLIIELSGIQYTPTGEITTTSGISAQKAWSDETATTQHSTNTQELGVEVGATVGVGVEGPSASATVTGHYTETWEQGTESSITKSTSGFTQNDWSTADTTDKEKAAIVSLIFNVVNKGTAPAQDITPYINMKLGEQEIATIGSLSKITSLPIGSTSKNLVLTKDESGEKIALSLDQLKSIECGSPLTIETFQIDAKAKKWDNDRKEWVLIDQDFSTYMDEINKKTATLITEFDDGSWRDYKVVEGLTLGKALNLTVGSDVDICERDMGFPIEANASIAELNNTNKSILDLKLKHGWIISIKCIRPLRDNLTISWASCNDERKVVSASVRGRNQIEKVLAHVKIGDKYKDLNMTCPDNNTIYLNKSNGQFEIDKNCYVMAIDIGNNSCKFNLSVPLKARLSRLKDGRYIIIAKNSENAMTCAGEGDGYNVYQYDSFGGPSQRWYLNQTGNGVYSIRNERYPDLYLEIDEGKHSEGANAQVGKNDKGNPSQQWYFVPDGKGNYVIHALHSNKCLTVDSGYYYHSNFNFSIIQEEDQQSQNQKWIIQPVDSYPFNLIGNSDTPTGGVLTRPRFVISSKVPVNNLQNSRYGLIANKNDVTASIFKTDLLNKVIATSLRPFMVWRLQPIGDGYFALRSADNRCLQVATANLSNRSNGIEVNISDYNGLDNQMWKFKSFDKSEKNITTAPIKPTTQQASNGMSPAISAPVVNSKEPSYFLSPYEICSKYSNKCLVLNNMDIQGGATSKCIQWEYQGYENQRFNVMPSDTATPIPTVYKIKVYTADEPYAGTDSKISLSLHGAYGDATTYELGDVANFEQGKIDEFYFKTTELGDIDKIKIHFDRNYPLYDPVSNNLVKWKLNKIEIEDTFTQKSWTFNYHNWIKDTGDTEIKRS